MFLSKFHAWHIKSPDFEKEKTFNGKLRFLTRFGILAPSSHNTQPWRFQIEKNSINLYADFSRRLLHSDLNGRMLYAALGCVIENIKVAADHYGLRCSVTYNKELEYGLPEFAARMDFETTDKQTYPEGLFEAITKRVSNRGVYIQEKQIPSEFFTEARRILQDQNLRYDIITSQKEKEDISLIVGSGMKQKMSDGDFRNELAHWLRTNWSFKRDGMPGEGHGMSLLLSILAPIILRRVNVSSVEEKKAIKRVRKFPALCIISSGQDNAFSWVKTGELLEKFLLLIHAFGMSASIMVAGIEDKQAREKLQKHMAGHYKNTGPAENFIPQMFFGFGFSHAKAPHSPRRPIEEVLI